VGVTILGLGVVRLLWRLGNVRPPLPPNMTWWERLLANGSHTYLYLGMLAMPLTGWIATDGFGSPVQWFGGIDLPQLLEPEPKEDGRPLTVLFAETHFWVAVGLTTFLVLHVAGALRHHFGLKDATLARMAPKGWLKASGG
jgi:cytochrome b561